MAHIRLRYSSGDEDEWELHQETPIGDLARTICAHIGPQQGHLPRRRERARHGRLRIGRNQLGGGRVLAHQRHRSKGPRGTVRRYILIASQEPLAE